MRRLEPFEWQSMTSPYIDSGYTRDRFQIKDIRVGGGAVRSICEMTAFDVSETDEDGFHLSVWTATAMISQICIIHAHSINEVAVKEHEALLGALNMDLKKPVRDPHSIPVDMTIVKSRLRESKTIPELVRAAYTWEYDIGAASFTGHLTAHFSFGSPK